MILLVTSSSMYSTSTLPPCAYCVCLHKYTCTLFKYIQLTIQHSITCLYRILINIYIYIITIMDYKLRSLSLWPDFQYQWLLFPNLPVGLQHSNLLSNFIFNLSNLCSCLLGLPLYNGVLKPISGLDP